MKGTPARMNLLLHHPVQIPGERLIDQGTHVFWKGQLVERRRQLLFGFFGGACCVGAGAEHAPTSTTRRKRVVTFIGSIFGHPPET